MKIKGNNHNDKQTTNVKMCNLAYVTSLVYNLVMCTFIRHKAGYQFRA